MFKLCTVRSQSFIYLLCSWWIFVAHGSKCWKKIFLHFLTNYLRMQIPWNSKIETKMNYADIFNIVSKAFWRNEKHNRTTEFLRHRWQIHTKYVTRKKMWLRTKLENKKMKSNCRGAIMYICTIVDFPR